MIEKAGTREGAIKGWITRRLRAGMSLVDLEFEGRKKYGSDWDKYVPKSVTGSVTRRRATARSLAQRLQNDPELRARLRGKRSNRNLGNVNRPLKRSAAKPKKLNSKAKYKGPRTAQTPKEADRIAAATQHVLNSGGRRVGLFSSRDGKVSVMDYDANEETKFSADGSWFVVDMDSGKRKRAGSSVEGWIGKFVR